MVTIIALNNNSKYIFNSFVYNFLTKIDVHVLDIRKAI